MAFRMGMEMLRIMLNPRLHTRNEKNVMIYTHAR